nr:MAG TPA: dimeris T4 recombination endonuclease VII [Caudoviricetes sp.]
MSEVAIIATRRFQFGAGLMRDGSFDRFVTTPNVTMMMPERFMNDPLFIKAHELGLLMVVSNVRTTPVASVTATKVVNEPKVEDSSEDNPSGSGEVDELANLTAEELIEKAEELGIEVPDGIGKKKLKKLIREAM